jgi:hypothetical protein
MGAGLLCYFGYLFFLTFPHRGKVKRAAHGHDGGSMAAVYVSHHNVHFPPF